MIIVFMDKNYGTKKSTKKGGTTNPVYGETFEFEDIPDDLDKMDLNVKVMDGTLYIILWWCCCCCDESSSSLLLLLTIAAVLLTHTFPIL